MNKHVKKIILFLGILIIIVLATCCYLFKKEVPKFYDIKVKDITLFEFEGKDTVEWAKKYDSSSPPTLTVYINHCEYGEDPKVITNKKTINEVYNALSKIQLTGRKNLISSTGTTTTYSFKNGKENISFSFQDGKIPTNEGQYYIKNTEALSKIQINSEGETNYE